MRKYIFPIVILAGIFLTGCVVIHQGRREDATTADAVEGKSYAISYDQQIDLILENKEKWCFLLPEDAVESEEQFVTEADYYYLISDLDQNGRLEVISSTTTGNGSYFFNVYYEVGEDGTELKKCNTVTSDRGEVPEPDLWGFSGERQGYYDRQTGVYHYPQWDHTHSSAADTEDAREDMVLLNGVVTVNTICGSKSRSTRKGCITEYYAGDEKKKLGETGYTYKRDWEPDNPKEAKRYEKKLEKIVQQYYAGMEEFTVKLKWFQNINKKEYYDSDKIRVLSDEKLRERMMRSWNGFGIDGMGEGV